MYYRKERDITYERLMNIATHDNDAKRAFTDAVLATVGLKTVDDDQDIVPWYIILSRIQRSWVKKASEHGYKVGLT